MSTLLEAPIVKASDDLVRAINEACSSGTTGVRGVTASIGVKPDYPASTATRITYDSSVRTSAGKSRRSRNRT